jgi:hypothetical protein
MRDLLTFIDEVVTRDAAPPGISGTICFGVRYSTYVRWWIGTFGGKVTTAFSEEKPAKYDVAVGLDEAGAWSLLGAPIHGEKMQVVAGDRELLRKFVRRYFKKQSALMLRTQATKAKGHGRRTRHQ